MILKGSQRAGAGQLATHLLNARDNDHVHVHDLRGFVADDLRGALDEARAIATGTRCKQHLFSVSLNPPKGAEASEKDFEEAAERIEAALGLEGQPRAIVLHEKEGRRHAHVVWSRIDPETMRAINLPHFKRKLTALSRELYLEHGWSLPEGLRSNGGRSPLNFTLDEWQQAKRLGTDPREIKDIFRDAWARSDSLAALRGALEERGYFLARGDRRGIVALNLDGEVFALARWSGVKAREVKDRCGDGADLPSVDEAQADLSRRVSGKLRDFIGELRTRHAEERTGPRNELKMLCARQRRERKTLHARQDERWTRESEARATRLRTGLGGLWDKITGKAATIRAANERDALRALHRDRAQRDRLSRDQLRERDPLQRKLDGLRTRHAEERKLLAGEIARHLRRTRTPDPETPAETRERARRREGPSLDI